MPSFPPIDSLPVVLETSGWHWEQYDYPSSSVENFWIGLDQTGNKWLTKLRGGYRAYRELVFARAAQKMGWSCQSSAFMRLDLSSAKFLGVDVNEIQAAHWFMEEHPLVACSPECSLVSLFGHSINSVNDIAGSGVNHIMDWPKSYFAAYLFGGLEPPGHLFTTTHEFVIIDSELMFHSDPCDLSEDSWWKDGRQLAIEACRDLLNLTIHDLDQIFYIPETVSVEGYQGVIKKFKKSQALAIKFLAENS